MDRSVQDAERLERLRAEHARLEARLAELDRQRSLTMEEQRERAEIKKTKLVLKDDIARLSR